MRVLYDSRGFQERFGGVSRSFVKLLAHLPRDVKPVLAVTRTCNLALQRPPFGIAPCPDPSSAFLKGWEFRGKWRVQLLAQRLFPRTWPDYEAENRRCLDEHVARGDFDVLHLTGAHAYGEAWRRVAGRKPIVVTVHDLIPEIVRGRRRVAALRREVLAACDKILADSENTKRDLLRLYDLDEGKVAVVPLGWEDAGGAADARTAQDEGGYLLYVGRRDGYKNWAWFVAAVAPLLAAGRVARLVCTGAAFTRRERRWLKRLGVAGRVEQRFATDAEMAALYRGAAAFVYPSRYEGFGLPILEAWAARCPVVLARASCFPEIARDAAAYFDLDDAEGLRAAILDATGSDALRARGVARLKDFSWAKYADAVAQVYRSVLRLEKSQIEKSQIEKS